MPFSLYNLLPSSSSAVEFKFHSQNQKKKQFLLPRRHTRKIMSITRRPKWHPTPPPPPTPKILNLPRRTRRKQPPPDAEPRRNYRGKLEILFDQEREFTRSVPVVLLSSSERRGRVEEEGGGFAEERWRFQAEILRAECNFLRMERELALKKLERNRVQMERTLRSAVHTLLSGREKVHQGKNASVVLEEEIEDLAEKLEELQRSCGIRGFEVPNCSNFDKKASLLQRRLEKLGGLSAVQEIRELAESSLSINRIDQERSNDLEIVRRKMDGVSKDMLDIMEDEFGSMLSTAANSSVASSASTSKRIEFPDSYSFSTQESMSREENKCSGQCKAFMQRIVEQVRAETEQWSQMQEMVGQVRDEMEQLHSSRDFWEDRALHSDYQIQSLLSSLEEWRQKALTFEAKANEQETEISVIRGQLEQKREVRAQDWTPISLGKQLEKDKRVLICRVKEENNYTAGKGCKEEIGRENLMIEQNQEELLAATKDLPPVLLGRELAKEKRVLICRFKENNPLANDGGSRKQKMSSDGRRKAHTSSNGLAALTRSPFQDIENSSPLARQNCNTAFPLHCPEPSKLEES